MRIDPDFTPIFIVGHPRSGSTLLASLLGNHSKVAAMPETHFVRSSIYGGNPVQRLFSKRDLNTRIAFLYRNVRLRDIGISAIDFITYCKNHQVNYKSDGEILQAFLMLCRDTSGKERILEKTPAHIVHAEKILNWLPGARIISITRDARDTVQSLMKVPWTHSDPSRHAAYWAWCVRKAMRLQKDYPHKFIAIRYEDLLEDPQAILDSLCSFCGLSYEANMLAERRESSVVPDWEVQWKNSSQRKIDPSNAHKWQKNASHPIHEMVVAMTTEEIMVMKYPISSRPYQDLNRKAWLLRTTSDIRLYADRVLAKYLSGSRNNYAKLRIGEKQNENQQ